MREILIAPTAIRHDRGHLHLVDLALPPSAGDDGANPHFSDWRLFEDGQELPAPHSVHGDIEHSGLGRYSHWGATLYFSASDNSDPANNGRRYTLRCRRTRLMPDWVRKRSRIASLKVFGLIACLGLRLAAWVLFLPELVRPRVKSLNARDFAKFYAAAFELTEPPRGTFLSSYFRQFLDREFFRTLDLPAPSIEIGVHNGVTSHLFMNHAFDVGTEFYFRQIRQIPGLLHKTMVEFDLKNPGSLSGSFRTLVMVHSVDDFDSADTGLIFKAYDHLLDSNGSAYFSGFTEYYATIYPPQRLLALAGIRKSFTEITGYHPENMIGDQRIAELAAPFGFEIVRYREACCDRRLIWLVTVEMAVARLIDLGRLKRWLWRLPMARAAHIRINTVLAAAFYHAEMRARARGERGIDFACCIRRRPPAATVAGT